MAMRTILYTIQTELQPDSVVNQVEILLRRFFPSLGASQRISLGETNGFLVVLHTEDNNPITFTLRFYCADKLFTLNGEAAQGSDEFNKFNNLKLDQLKNDIEKELQLKDDSVEKLPVLKRNNQVPIYFLTSDNRVLEYDFDSVLVHEKSKYQDIKILHSTSLGNALLLDDLQNLAEADLNYTRGLMNFGKNDFKGKDILILGGGDGGLLHELLKEEPKFVTMVDIDGLVMKHCQRYLRGACGSSLDSWKGENYLVLEDDCIRYMKQYIEEGRTFDYVFNDLTDIPISTKDNKDLLLEDSAEKWQFVSEILQLTLQLIRPDGKYLNHAIGVGCVTALEEYESLLNSLPIKVNFSRHTAYVPSFLEEWVFYEIWKVST